jgi:hypothetical protein
MDDVPFYRDLVLPTERAAEMVARFDSDVPQTA